MQMCKHSITDLLQDKKTPLDFIKDAELIDKLKRAGGGAK
jgi:hypothetical protein